MAKYSGSGWHFQRKRHSDARKYGRAGGSYVQNYSKVDKRKFLKDFEDTLEMAEMRALSKHSLEHPLTDKQYERLMFLAKKHTGFTPQKHYGERSDWYADRPSWHDVGHRKEIIKGGLADNISSRKFNQEQLAKGIKVESEHTNNPLIAEEISKDHIIEDKKYYDKLEKIEGKPKPIIIKTTKKHVIRAKNELEKHLSKAIRETKNPVEKKELKKIYSELRKADDKNKLKRFWKEYGYSITTIGEALPFYVATPVMIAAVALGASMGIVEVSAPVFAPAIASELGAFVISTEATKHSIRTINAIRKREKEIISEKTKELRENTSLNDKDIKIISKRVAQQELANTPLVNELV